MVSQLHDDPDAADQNLTPTLDKSALSKERKRMFDQVEAINRAWLDSMRAMRRAEAEFSVRLFACQDSKAALVICNQWMAKRLEILGTEQQMFARCWSELVATLDQATAHKKTKPEPAEPQP